ncbi:YecA family protein [Oceanobacter mangrovi]|uniref:YecA/YgfB family protein n=1 Tax=Oceanobacter mangrovi TaxID=2862510 RepID=UPI001C8E2042|nr:YecA family protein [Oceanobacter mangrovi]
MNDLNNIPALDENELERLGVLLEEEAERQDSFDFFAVHGLITALLVGPMEFDPELVWQAAFEEQLGFSKQEKQDVSELIIKLSKEIQAWLDSGADFPVPADLTLVDEEEEPPLESWAIGFVTGVMQHEEAWYASNEETVAECLFPVMYASGLFADEEEMADIDDDVDLSNQVCGGIPATIVDLYLHYHSQG